ncbi:hypothetical protein [Hyalangium versicolor]|uniref:hypothetical protein n=1 Tax=Hyalangium versicolor TaxID=2861190 RepID=UPI001CD027C0|nr:hypothetical protein [Hyalangium versicolor]
MKRTTALVLGLSLSLSSLAFAGEPAEKPAAEKTDKKAATKAPKAPKAAKGAKGAKAPAADDSSATK